MGAFPSGAYFSSALHELGENERIRQLAPGEVYGTKYLSYRYMLHEPVAAGRASSILDNEPWDSNAGYGTWQGVRHPCIQSFERFCCWTSGYMEVIVTR